MKLITRTYAFTAVHSISTLTLDAPDRNLHAHNYELAITVDAPDWFTPVRAEMDDFGSWLRQFVIGHDLNSQFDFVTTTGALLDYIAKVGRQIFASWHTMTLTIDGRDCYSVGFDDVDV